jgi:methylmalonyl-CoA mutase, N-terminal domain
MKAVDPDTTVAPPRERIFTTISGRPVKEVYTEADLSGFAPHRDLGQPGE